LKAGAFRFVFVAFVRVAGGFEGAGEAVGCYDCCGGERVALAFVLPSRYLLPMLRSLHPLNRNFNVHASRGLPFPTLLVSNQRGR